MIGVLCDRLTSRRIATIRYVINTELHLTGEPLTGVFVASPEQDSMLSPGWYCLCMEDGRRVDVFLNLVHRGVTLLGELFIVDEEVV